MPGAMGEAGEVDGAVALEAEVATEDMVVDSEAGVVVMVYDFLDHLGWGNESWHKQVDKAIGWYETVVDRDKQAYKDDVSKRPHLPLGYSFKDSREFSDGTKHKPHTKPALSPKRISKHNWSSELELF
ncbi:hypothetical protein WR25_19172 [Diploscapter pachys]|uniref:Uncharacterized protein n=1 Tax=Diploscapter pachys TaxID=2018661 RepID=A0A2A2JEY2_9BILA|nr:hypothetical protein WR25_19172 [Diploscapter pachys]